MRQIAEWLATIGLERYTPAFIDNDIDVEVLRYLTDADLEKIGVSLGHRRKLLAAIAELGDGAATPSQPPSELNKQEAVARREPTPTQATAAAPPEAAGDVLRPSGFDRHCREARCRGMARSRERLSRRRLGGGDGDGRSWGKKLGDGLMALF